MTVQYIVNEDDLRPYGQTTTRTALLDRAAEILAQRGAWTQYALARDKDGHETSPYDDAATCFCLNGAIVRAAYELNGITGSAPEMAVLSDIIFVRLTLGLLPSHGTFLWNDAPSRRKGQVIKALLRAAAAARP